MTERKGDKVDREAEREREREDRERKGNATLLVKTFTMKEMKEETSNFDFQHLQLHHSIGQLIFTQCPEMVLVREGEHLQGL